MFQSPLYEMNFNPVMSRKEFMVELEHNHDNDIIENGFSSLTNFQIPTEIKEEISKVLAAQYVVFIFPLWWERFVNIIYDSCPAILKGWFDRVLIGGILQEGGSFQGRNKINGKKAVVIVPASPAPAYSPIEDDTNTDTSILPIRRRKANMSKFSINLASRPFNERLKHITLGTLAFAGFNVLNLLSNETIH